MEVSDLILNQCKKGKQTAIKELYKTCYSLMMGISVRYQKSTTEAEDAMNLGFLKVVQNLDSFDKSRNFKTWFCKIIVNTNIDIYRSTQRHKSMHLYVDNYNAYEASHAEIEFTTDKEIEYETLLEHIEELPPMANKVFNLYVIDGYTHKEIADTLEISSGTSKWHLSSARKTLQAKLKQISSLKSVGL
jgi:RNA polymerase sigma-70 factor (ECF subfamily)